MLKYMNYVYTIYTEKSFTKAAEKLYISQPSLSLTIKKLEQEIGYPLFERCGKEITPTPIGEKYIQAIEQITTIENNLSNEIDDILKLRKGRISIGSTTFIASYILPNLLKDFRKEHPNIEINILVEQSTVLEEKLEKGLIDLVIDNTINKNPIYEYVPFFKERIIIGVPQFLKINEACKAYQIPAQTFESKNYDYESLPKINVSAFKDESFILLKQGNKMRQIARKIFEEQNISPHVCLEFDLLMTSLSYAESGFGICFLTDIILKYGKGGRNITFYLPDTKYSERTLYITYKKSKYLSCAASEFIDFARASEF